jgi:hypothetical protein
MALADAARGESAPPSWSARIERHILLIVAAVVLVAGIGAVVAMNAPHVCACASAWGLGSATPLAPGSPGCPPVSGTTCFAASPEFNQGGIALSGLSFEVLGPPTNSSNVHSGSPVDLGASAAVLVFGPTGDEVGDWNWTLGAWSFGASWAIPTNQPFSLVLNTGLIDANLAGDTLWVLVQSPDLGSDGSSL